MIRLAFTVSALALLVLSAPDAQAGRHHHHGRSAHHHGPHGAGYARERGPMLPPQTPYRDPRYRPVRHAPGPSYGPPVIRESVPPRALGVPLYNEPPPRFAPF